MDVNLPLSVTLEVRDRCLCLHLQKAARAIARTFDDALRPVNLTNGQYSLLISLNRPKPPRIKDLVPLLAMDSTTITAALKPLERRGLLELKEDLEDRRSRRIALTPDGIELLKAAVPIWRKTHDDIDTVLGGAGSDDLVKGLKAISREGFKAR